MCFMAIDSEVKSLELDNDDLLNDEIDERQSYDELLDDFNALHENMKKLILKNGVLKNMILSLTKELEDFSKEKKMKLTFNVCGNLKIENASLKEKILDFTKIIHKFTNEKKNFDKQLI